LLVVVAIIALLISILLPSLSRARELAKRLVCAANIKGIGTAQKIYANDNEEQWATPLFSEGTLGQPATIDYVSSNVLPHGGGENPARDKATTSTSTALSVSRAFWLLIRSGETTQKQYICPSSGDEADVTEEIDKFYDFFSLTNLSYGYQVPFGLKETRASENADPRMALAADSSPHTTGSNLVVPSAFDTNTSPRLWQPYNSGNHGGAGAGEGQNVLYQDSHAVFERKPIVGIDNDNIYTQMSSSWPNQARFVGKSPLSPASPWPGWNALGPSKHASTDSLLYP
jgi:type II secretory pathway pseudopilin PulG